MIRQQGYDYFIDQETGKEKSVQLATGEVSDAITTTVPVGTIFYTPEQQEAYRLRKQLEAERREKEEQRRFWRKSAPEFFFATAESCYEDIRPATAARLIYLATYIRYDGKLWRTERRQMKRKDLLDIMGLSQTETYRFWNEVFEKYVFEDNNDTLYMRGEFFHRGKLSPGNRYQRFYVEAVRELYRLATVRQHKYLGYVFQMVPFVSKEFNILCHNSQEKDLDKVVPLSVDEFCGAANYDPANRARLIKAYSKITFPVGETQERFCSFVTDGCDIGTANIFVNPHILYHGNNAERVEVLGKFCQMRT